MQLYSYVYVCADVGLIQTDHIDFASTSCRLIVCTVAHVGVTFVTA